MKVFGLLLLLAGMVDGAAISPAQDLGRERRSYFDDSVDSDYVFRNGICDPTDSFLALDYLLLLQFSQHALSSGFTTANSALVLDVSWNWTLQTQMKILIRMTPMVYLLNQIIPIDQDQALGIQIKNQTLGTHLKGICRCCPGLGGLLLVLKLTNQDFVRKQNIKLACVNDRPPQLGTSVSPHCKILPLLFFLPNFHLAFQVLFS
ncbi:uncharacterized protein LOC119928472 isoform X19 [Tachyglossus aculeatus]|uniref:uncharacterized protein LOC119928472 isoform X19 n=1 Tax=Tachyglossus aculeatus TaxID=9261 RepID=UPI0018F4EB47|nr:uncharacterized protein LOC119928472 isoform X19 [Tachyglossus aculeatus]